MTFTTIRNLICTLVLSLISFAALAEARFLDYNPNLHEIVDGKYAMKDQLLIGVRPGAESVNSERQLMQVLKTKGLKIANSEVISSNSAQTKIIKLKLANHQSIMASRNMAENIPNVKWVQPNYIYNIGFDPREAAPNDPLIVEQYHHNLMQNLKAWDVSNGNGVIVAVTDDGFDLNHEDLATRFIANKAHNFCDDSMNVLPDAYYGDHGTHVSGTIATDINNGFGGAGVANGASILPVKFAGDCAWTSELIYRAYKYSVDNGAKIISTSYNVDGFVGDKTFAAALDYEYNRGVLHFNSAGNNDEQDPPRGTFKQLILVASTNDKDVKSDFSNYGQGVQISAPGEEILSTTPKNTYTKMSGTSMATPNAAGSAALIWSLHPSWNRDQVVAQLVGTADNIDEKNPKYKGQLGGGRVNNYRALTEEVLPAKVANVIVDSRNTESNKKEVTISIRFDKLLDPNVVNQGGHWEIKSLADSSVATATMKQPWFIGSMILELVVPELQPGKYQLTLKDTLKDPFGQALDGKGEGKAGSAFVYEFVVT